MPSPPNGKPIILKWKGNPQKNTLTATYIDHDDFLFIAVVTLAGGKWCWKVFEFGTESVRGYGAEDTAYVAMQQSTQTIEEFAYHV